MLLGTASRPIKATLHPVKRSEALQQPMCQCCNGVSNLSLHQCCLPCVLCVVRPVSLATIAVINSARIALERARVRAGTASPGTPQQTDHVIPASTAHGLLPVRALLSVVTVAYMLSCDFLLGLKEPHKTREPSRFSPLINYYISLICLLLILLVMLFIRTTNTHFENLQF